MDGAIRPYTLYRAKHAPAHEFSLSASPLPTFRETNFLVLLVASVTAESERERKSWHWQCVTNFSGQILGPPQRWARVHCTPCTPYCHATANDATTTLNRRPSWMRRVVGRCLNAQMTVSVAAALTRRRGLAARQVDRAGRQADATSAVSCRCIAPHVEVMSNRPRNSSNTAPTSTAATTQVRPQT